MLDFIILMLATWRISSLLISEAGPFKILEWFRYQIGVRVDEYSQTYGTNEFAELFTCIWCLSIWTGLALAIMYLNIPLYTTWLCLPFALSAGAVIIDKWLR